MTGYWDIHNHILPGVDDGSGCMRETMEMLEEEYRQGVRHIVFTPHYRRDMFAIPREEIQTSMRASAKWQQTDFRRWNFIWDVSITSIPMHRWNACAGIRSITWQAAAPY